MSELLAEEHLLVGQLVEVLLGRILRSRAFMRPTVLRWVKSFGGSTMHVAAFLEHLFAAVLKEELRFEVILYGSREPAVSMFYLFTGTVESVSLPMYGADMEDTERDMLLRLVPFFASQWRGTGISYSIRCVSFTHMEAVRRATDRMAVARRIVQTVLEQALPVPEAPRLVLRWMLVAALKLGPSASGLVELLRDPDPLWEELASEHAAQFRRWCTDTQPDMAQQIWST